MLNFEPLKQYYETVYDHRLEQAKTAQAFMRSLIWPVARPALEQYRTRTGLYVRRGGGEWHWATGDYTLNGYLKLTEPYQAVQDGDDWPTYTMVGVDGSQAMPDSRQPFPWAAVRVASVAVLYGQEEEAQIVRRWIGPDDPDLLSILTNRDQDERKRAAIGALRDRKEIEQLVSVVRGLKQRRNTPVLAMADGPLHLLQPTPEQALALGNHLQSIRAAGAIPVGFVGGGHARYVVRMLQILASGDGDDATMDNPWPEVSDFDLFGYLQEGQASPVFGLASSCNALLRDAGLPQVGFFYMNIAGQVSRVEIPLDLGPGDVHIVQSLLVTNAGEMGYPYALIKAHLAAKVTAKEKDIYAQQFLAQLSAVGLGIGMSRKEALKADT